MAMSEEAKVRAVFYKFVGSDDYQDEPTESFDYAMSREVPQEDDTSVSLLYHQVVNSIAYLGHFESPCELSESDLQFMKDLWPLLAPRDTNRCYLPAFKRVLLAKEDGTLDELKKEHNASSSSSSAEVVPTPPPHKEPVEEKQIEAVKPVHEEPAEVKPIREAEPVRGVEPIREEPVEAKSREVEPEPIHEQVEPIRDVEDRRPTPVSTPTPVKPSEDPVRNLDTESRASVRETYTTPLPPMKPEPGLSESKTSPHVKRLPERLEKMLRERQLEKEGSLPRSERKEEPKESRDEPREYREMPMERMEEPRERREEPSQSYHSPQPQSAQPARQPYVQPQHLFEPKPIARDEKPEWDAESKPSITSPRGVPGLPASPASHSPLRHQQMDSVSMRSASSPLRKGTASIYTDNSKGQVEISWNKDPPGSPAVQQSQRSQSVEPKADQPNNEQILLKRIIEMREELGRLKRDRANWERMRREQGYNVTAHEEFGGQTHGSGKSLKYSWNAGGCEQSTEGAQDVIPQYEYDEQLRRRWPSRDQQLVMELEYLHANVVRERELKTKRENMDLDIDDGLSMTATSSRFEPLQGKTQQQLTGSGWDQYQPPEDKEMVVPVSLVVDLGERTSYRQLRTSGRANAHKFKDVARSEIAQAFKHPDHLVQMKRVNVLDDHTIALELVLMGSGMKVRHVHADAIDTLDNFGIRRLKEGSRAFYAATGANTPCDILFKRSQVGEPTVNGEDEGLSNEVLMLVEMPYAQFEPARFVTSLSRHIDVENLCIELKSVNNVEGISAVHLKVLGTDKNRRIARELVRQAKSDSSSLHTAVGRVRDAEVIAEDEVESDASTVRSSRGAKRSKSGSRRRRSSVKSSASVSSSDDGRRSRSRSRSRRRRSEADGSSDSKHRRRKSRSRSRSRRAGSASDSSTGSRRRRRSSVKDRIQGAQPPAQSSFKQPFSAPAPEPFAPADEPVSPTSERSRSRRRRAASKVGSLADSRRSASPEGSRRRRSRSAASPTSPMSPGRPTSIKAPPSSSSPSVQGRVKDAVAGAAGEVRSRSRSKSRRSRSVRSESPEKSRRRRRSRSRGGEEPQTPPREVVPQVAGSHRQPSMSSKAPVKQSAPGPLTPTSPATGYTKSASPPSGRIPSKQPVSPGFRQG